MRRNPFKQDGRSCLGTVLYSTATLAVCEWLATTKLPCYSTRSMWESLYLLVEHIARFRTGWDLSWWRVVILFTVPSSTSVKLSRNDCRWCWLLEEVYGRLEKLSNMERMIEKWYGVRNLRYILKERPRGAGLVKTLGLPSGYCSCPNYENDRGWWSNLLWPYICKRASYTYMV